jgi:hypothetical protein
MAETTVDRVSRQQRQTATANDVAVSADGLIIQPKRDADARGVPVWGLAALRSSSMAALAVFIFQCAGTDLYALTLYRDGHNLPAAVCTKGVSRVPRVHEGQFELAAAGCPRGHGRTHRGWVLHGQVQPRYTSLSELRSSRSRSAVALIASPLDWAGVGHANSGRDRNDGRQTEA